MTTATVRAKMRCTEIAQTTSSYGAGPKPVEHTRVKLTCLAGPGNEEWSKYTPSGSVEMSITNPSASSAFEVGQDYFVDFARAPAASGGA